jgi:SAM-dependent methyltransferase
MYEMAPGNVLQNMYLKERLASWQYSDMRFCEVGSGIGMISSIFLHAGCTGLGIDLNNDACKENRSRNADFIAASQYEVRHGDFLADTIDSKFDLIISSMVIEHLDTAQIDTYFAKAAACLRPGGRIVVFVPAGMAYWGVEDEIAGHYRRYSRDDLRVLAARQDYTVVHLAGLTCPLSNLLLPISDRIVGQREGWKEDESLAERTRLSGKRDVKFKTTFPPYVRCLVNEVTMLPLHWIQKMLANSACAMVLYCEFVPSFTRS